MTIARNIRMGGARNLQLRVDMFNAPNAAGITARNTTMTLASPADPVTITNLPYDRGRGHPAEPRAGRRNAGFGQATGWQTPRAGAGRDRFSF